MTWKRWSSLALIVLCLGPAASERPCAGESPKRPGNWIARGEEVVRLVRQYFYDRKRADAWSAKYAGYARTVESEAGFVALTRQALGELKASHTGYFTTQEQKYYGLLAIFANPLHAGTVEWDSPGADFSPDHYVRIVFAEGPAARAGLRRGDKIFKANGADFQPISSFQGRSGHPVVLSVQRLADQAPITLRITPRRINPVREWLEAEQKGARILSRNRKKVAYVPFFSCAGEQYQNALQEMLNGRLREADALVLDFRDGFGGCNPDFVNLFNPTPAILTFKERDGAQRRLDAQWRKPLVVLINGGTSSGKEVVAYSTQKHRLGTLVGQRTAGAVLAGRCFLLSDRSLMYLAVNDIDVDGQRLEGRGVAPDIEVADALPFANGDDPQLDKAIEVAAGSSR